MMKMFRKIGMIFILSAGIFNNLFCEEIKYNYKPRAINGEPVQANEVWSWVMVGKEDELEPDYPITDIGYFAAEVSCYGELEKIPERSKLSSFNGRVHLTVICEGKSTSHLVMEPKFGLTDKLVQDIMKAAEPYDGVDIDFELILERDRNHFISFLEKINKACKKSGKVLSVCVPARTKFIEDDVYRYDKIAEVCDRVIIMAYDEHWATSKPGAVASYEWSRNIARYAKTVIPEEKLVMGMPFYGRCWQTEKIGKAMYWEGANRFVKEYGSGSVKYVNEVPVIDVKAKVHGTLFFDDAYSLVAKMRVYDKEKINNFAFWRVGQEDDNVWKWIKISEKSEEMIQQ